MTAPKIPPINVFPTSGMVPNTYPEYVNKLSCSCPAGALIKAAPLPSATKNLGDVIADAARVLQGFTSIYGMITVILRLFGCIIDVLCAIPNPFAIISAIIKLFGSCLPDLVLMFPQFAVPAIIICIIKIILAIIEYIMTVILPVILEIIKNISMIIKAFSSGNQDMQLAVAFKIASLFKELQNILGILAALGALWTMIKALLNIGIALPCGGSDSCCTAANCPATIGNNTELTGTDGILSVIYTFSVPQIYFSSASIVNNLKDIINYFPSGFDYVSVSDKDKLPYLLTIDGADFAVSSVDSNGTATLQITEANYITDGYLINTNTSGDGLPTTDARFYSSQGSFISSYVNSAYVILQDTRSSADAALNNGTWQIKGFYDSYNVLLQKGGTDTWSYDTGASVNDIKWSFAPATGIGKDFTLEIHHEELIRHNLIGVGCHPAVKATMDGVSNRFPQLKDTSLPALPDLDALTANLTSCLTAVAPLNITSEWVLDNYNSMATNILGLESCINSNLSSFQSGMTEYAKGMISKVLDLENSVLAVDTTVQLIGREITVSVIPVDRNGSTLALGLPPGTIEVEVNASMGTLSPTTEVLDAYGVSTGVFAATLVGYYELSSQIGATIDGYDVATFDGYALQPRYIDVQFVAPSTYKKLVDGSSEPLGVGNNG